MAPIVTAFAVLVLVACGGGRNPSAEVLADACVSSSDLDAALCDCIAGKASDELSPRAVEFLVASMRGDDRAAELRAELPLQEAIGAGTFITSAPARCAQELREG